MPATPLGKRLLPLFILLYALFIAAAPARAGDFKPGAYTERTKDGTILWELNFKPSAKATTLFEVTGTMGSLISASVNGAYSTRTNKFTGSSMRPSWNGVQYPIGLLDLNGHWDASRDAFIVEIPGGKPTVLKLDTALPDPNLPKVTIKSVDLEPAVSGALLKGTVTLTTCQFTEPGSVTLIVEVTPLGTRETKSAVAHQTFLGNGEVRFDLAQLPVTVAQDVETVSVRIQTECHYSDPGRAVWQQDVPVQLRTRAVSVVKAGIGFGEGPNNTTLVVPYFYLRAREDKDQTKLRAEVVQTYSVTPRDGTGAYQPLQTDTGTYPCSTNPDGALTDAKPLDISKLAPGDYRVMTRLEGPDVTPYTFVNTLTVPQKLSPDTPQREQSPVVTGSVAVDKSLVKPKESLRADVKYSYSEGPDSLAGEAIIDLIDPKGATSKSIKKLVTLTRGKPITHGFNIESDIPGIHTVRVRVSGPKGESWTQSATFRVEEKPKAEAKPEVKKPETTQIDPAKPVWICAGPKVTIGKTKGVSGGANNCAVTTAWEENPKSGSVSWSSPPLILQDKQEVTLTMNCSAQDWPYMGGKWYAPHYRSLKNVGQDNVGSTKSWRPESPQSSSWTFVFDGSGAWKQTIWCYGGMSGNWLHENNQVKVEWEYERQDKLPADLHKPPVNDPVNKPADQPTDEGDEELTGASMTPTDPNEPEQEAQLSAWLDPASITLYAGEISRSIDVHITGYRRNTADRVEVLFPQKLDGLVNISLPGQIVSPTGEGSYDVSNMGTPEHIDGYFLEARETAPTSDQIIEFLVRQDKAGFVLLKLKVHVVGKPQRVAGNSTTPPPQNPPPTRPSPRSTGVTLPPSIPGPPLAFGGTWQTTFGVVTLVQRDDHVEGRYRGGVIVGTVNGNTLTFRMDETPHTPYSGEGVFVLGATGDTFEGGWAQSSSAPLGPWRGRRTSTEVPDDMGTANPRDPNAGGHKPPSDLDGGDGGDPNAQKSTGIVDFTPGKLAANDWNSVANADNDGSAARVEGDQLVLTVPQDSGGSIQSFSGTTYTGDFDFVVDYKLIDWKTSDESTLSWSLMLSPWRNEENDKMVEMTFDDNEAHPVFRVEHPRDTEVLTAAATGAREGSLRVTRSGKHVKFAQLNGGSWQLITDLESELPAAVHVGFMLERQGPVAGKVSLRPRPAP